MAKNRAIIVGVNQYHFLQHLKYAKRDAELLCDFLCHKAGFDREDIFLFTDDSLPVDGKSTEPFRANLLRVLRQVSERLSERTLEEGNNFWFFFSGHGIRCGDRDYLMPLDGDPENVEGTGIATYDVTDYLRRCKADNVVLILDACRSQGRKGEGIGRQTEAEVRETGIISIFSCHPNQSSYEIEVLQQGAFTVALLEGLGDQGRCATVEQLNQYLKNRVPEIVHQYHSGRTQQIPYIIAEPIERSHLFLMPQYATSSDMSALKNDAHRAEDVENLDLEEKLKSLKLAEQLWLQVNAAALGKDQDVIRAIQRIESKRIRLQEIQLPVSKFYSQQTQYRTNTQRGLEVSFNKVNDPDSIPVSKVTSSNDNSLDQEIDYTKLKSMLEMQNWKEADNETYRLILQVVGREAEHWFAAKDQSKLPRIVISTINQLWVENSDRKFGFSIQQQIWCSDDVGGQPGKFDRSVFRKFGDRVGWRRNNDWLLEYGDFDFSLGARAGHLPSFGYAIQQWDRWKDSFQNLFPYICTCL
jgi:uncharacterized caspase-like protein